MPYEVSCSYCGHTQIYKPRNDKIPKKPHTNCKKCSKDFSIDISTSEDIPKIPNLYKQNILTKSNQNNPPQILANKTTFIDDPDELLMSVAVRELNKPNPDPRWANVLITTRKANIGHSTKEGKIRSRFKSMNIKDIAKISAGKPVDFSQKQDLEESF